MRLEKVNFFYYESKFKLKKKKTFFLEGGGGGGERTDRQTCPNQFAPSTSSKLGA